MDTRKKILGLFLIVVGVYTLLAVSAENDDGFCLPPEELEVEEDCADDESAFPVHTIEDGSNTQQQHSPIQKLPAMLPLSGR